MQSRGGKHCLTVFVATKSAERHLAVVAGGGGWWWVCVCVCADVRNLPQSFSVSF